MVAGAAALVVAQHPAWTAAEIEQQLLATARDAGPEGRDRWYGAGVLDALAATGERPRRASAPPPGDGDGTPDRARSISILPGAPTQVTGRLDREGDEDWYAIDLPGDAEVAMTLYPVQQMNVDRAQSVDAIIDIFNPSRQHLYRIDGRGPEGREDFDLLLPGGGRWYFRVTSSASSRSPEPYTFGGTYVTTGAQGRARFLSPEWLGHSSPPASTAIADVTGDGRSEVLMTTASHTGDENDYTLFVHETGPEGELLEPQVLDTGAREMWTSDGGTLNSSVMGLATGDLDGDGRTDAAVAAGRWIAVFPQRQGHLASAEPVPGSQGADQVEAADIDGDGRLDLVATMNRDGGPAGEQTGVVAFLRRGTGWERRVVSGQLGAGIAVGDVSGDGRPDVVGAGSASISIARQRTDGSFAVEVMWDDAGEGVAVADVTGDGRADVVTTSGYATDGARTLDVRAQTATGGLAAPVGTSIYYPGQAIEVGDVDRDGRRDVVVLEDGCWCAGIFLQRAGGTLAPEERYDVGRRSWYLPSALSLGDVDGDGALDMAAADNGFAIVRQHTAGYPRQSWIRDATPQDGAAGVAAGVVASVRFGRALDAASVAGAARLQDARGGTVAGAAAYDAATRTLTFRPAAALPAGGYVLQLDGLRDSFGARPPDGLAVRFTVGAATNADTAAPDTGIVSAPSGITRASGEPFTRVFSSEPLVTFECSFDTGAWAPCPPDKPSGADMPYGVRTFRVRAVDGAGRVDPTPATRTWTIDHFGAAPANDTTDAAQVLSGTSGSVRSSSHRADPDQAVSEDNGGGRSVWFRWTAPADGTATFDTAGSGFDTLLGVFVDDDPNVNGPLALRTYDDDAGPGVLTSRVQLWVRAGATYLIGVDGFADPVHAQSGAVTLTWALAAASGLDGAADDDHRRTGRNRDRGDVGLRVRRLRARRDLRVRARRRRVLPVQLAGLLRVHRRRARAARTRDRRRRQHRRHARDVDLVGRQGRADGELHGVPRRVDDRACGLVLVHRGRARRGLRLPPRPRGVDRLQLAASGDRVGDGAARAGRARNRPLRAHGRVQTSPLGRAGGRGAAADHDHRGARPGVTPEQCAGELLRIGGRDLRMPSGRRCLGELQLARGLERPESRLAHRCRAGARYGG